MISRRPGHSYLTWVAPGILKPLILLLPVLIAAGRRSAATAQEIPLQQAQEARCDTLELEEADGRISLSSRFVVPGSLRLFCDSTPLVPELYRLDHVRGLIYLDSSLTCSSLVAAYLAWPFTFKDSFRLRSDFADSLLKLDSHDPPVRSVRMPL